MPSLAGLANRATQYVFLVLEHVFPARRNYWCFCTWDGGYPHTLDNPRAVFEEVKDDASIVKVILARSPLRGGIESTIEGERVVVVEAETLRGAYYLAISKVILLGYGSSGVASYGKHLTTKHRIVQLWHGIPLKRIGKLFPGERFWEAETPKYAATVCSSGPDRENMSNAFAPIPREEVWQTGLPRNDLILKPESGLPADYRRQLAELRTRLASRRLVFYAPTWREHGVGIYEFSSEEERALAAVLTRHDAVLGIRGHANRRTRLSDAAQASRDGIIYLNDLPDVNLILRETAVLITDYSSLYIDFLVLDRPVLHFTYDIDTYVKERGFLYDLEAALASPYVRTCSELAERLDDALRRGITSYDWHARAKRLFHDHEDRSALQVANRIRRLSASS